MPEVTLAYETYGTLAPDGRNAVLLTHGYTSSQHMAGRYRRERRRGLVGRAGRTRQGDRHRPAVRRVVQHAGLVLRLDQSGLHQSRRPASPTVPDFPDITLVDIVNAQKALLDGWA